MKANMYKRAGAGLTLGFAVLASGCGGSGQSSVPTGQTRGGVVSGSAKVTLSIKVPARNSSVASASAKRLPQYVSAFTRGIGVRAGTTAGILSAQWQLFDVSAGAPSCSTDAASGVRTCVVSVTAPAVQGAVDEFQIIASDKAPATTDTIPEGNFLSAGDTTQTVNIGAANALTVSLTGVIGTLATAKPGYSIWAAPGQPANVVVGIIANDIDGGQIFGQPASFANPLTFSDGLTQSPFTYPSANPPANYGLGPPQTVGPVEATIGYVAPSTVTMAAVTVTVSTIEPSYLAAPAVPPSATFTLSPIVVSANGSPIGSLTNLTLGTQVLVKVNESNATVFTVSDNAAAQAGLTLLNAAGTAPILSPSQIGADATGTAAFIVSAVRATGSSAALTIQDADGTAATLPVATDAAAAPLSRSR